MRARDIVYAHAYVRVCVCAHVYACVSVCVCVYVLAHTMFLWTCTGWATIAKFDFVL